ncbi:MAG: hypothetical protein BGP04_11080 [Rhizobiales bacterium 62-17]|nr:tetratricopeptide repeat protein [Hyphomicrobiales bacterium]OJY05864.1 MAG: hypothetical protein BGP04_11080 [Rhizobiales bacterium 62-17]
MGTGSTLHRTGRRFGLVAALTTWLALPAFGQTAADDTTCHKGAGQPAIEACTRIIDAKRASGRERAVLFNDRGLLFHKAGDAARAIADLDEAIKTDATLAPAWFNRGLANTGLGHFDRAIADFTRAGIIAPQRAIIWQSRGGAYSRKGDDAQAIEDYSRAIGLDPKLAIAWASRGLARARNDNLDQAVADLAEAVRLEPDNKAYAQYLQEAKALRDRK